MIDAVNIAFGANTTVTVTKNPWCDVIIGTAAQAHFSVGVSQVAVASGATNPQYFWTQTAGVSCCWADTNTAIGIAMTSGTTAGQFELAAAADQLLAVNLWTAVDGEYNPAYLTVSS